MALLPPSPALFASQTDLLHYLKVWGAENEYATVIAHSVPSRNYASVMCNRGGKYRNTHGISDAVPHQKRGQVKTDCTFRLKAHVKHGSWTFEVQDPAHNHPAFASDMAPVSLRTWTAEQVNRVLLLTYTGASAQTIAVHIRHGDYGANESCSTVQDIVNARRSLRLQMLAGRMPVQALLMQITEEGWVRSFEADMEGHLTRLFFASPVSLSSFGRYPEVLILDCT